MINLAFGGIKGHPREGDLSPSFPTFNLGGSKRNFIGHDISFGGIGFDGVGDLIMIFHY
jgi:hypothetical protein